MKIKKLFLILFVFVLAILFNNVCFARDLDQINKYYITVEPRNDGTLDMSYHIEWEVLDSTSEGPLSWVKIGIPNSNVDSIKSLSKEIKSIKYYEDNGAYIRVDFKKDYNAGDIIKFDFTFHQKYMYELNSSFCIYNFTPGWFDDIAVEDIQVYWNAKNVESSSAEETNSDGYLSWSARLAKGAKLNTKVVYYRSSFNKLDVNQQYSNANITYSNSNNYFNSMFDILVPMLIAFVVLSVLLSLLGTGYRGHSGYGYSYGRPYHHHHHHHTSHHSSCASSHSCVSSCACACACAGGGRAGCSKKDFYGTNLKTNNVKKVLKK